MQNTTNPGTPPNTRQSTSSTTTHLSPFGVPIDLRTLLSTVWIAALIADVLRGVHETLRPGYIEELAFEGTNYGRQVTNGTLFWSGIVFVFITSVVVLARVLPRRSNRWVNVVAAVLMSTGVLALWPKDPDDYVFGAFQLLAAALIVVICARWTDSTDSASAGPTAATGRAA